VISHTGICLNDHKKMYDRSAWGIFHEHWMFKSKCFFKITFKLYILLQYYSQAAVADKKITALYCNHNNVTKLIHFHFHYHKHFIVS
jgi:hypothetical protein